MERISTIKPGFLVSLSVTLRGGVAYSRRDLESDRQEETKTETWVTTKTVTDAEEHERAKKVQSTIGSILRRSLVPFGRGGASILPLSREQDFEAARKRALVLVDEFNRSAQHCQLGVYVLRGKIASTDEEAARAIGDEVRSLVDAMSRGIDKLDANAIRDAADRARKLGAVLDPAQEATVSEAIKQARKAARTIVKRIEKDAEDSVIVLKDIQRGAIEKARLAFIDLEPIEANQGDALPAVDLARIAEIDLESDSEEDVAHDTQAPNSSEGGETLAASE